MKNSILIISCILLFACTHKNQKSYTEQAYQSLNSIVENKKQQLLDYLTVAKKTATQIKEDNVMSTFFNAKIELCCLDKGIEVPQDILIEMDKLETSIQTHYIKNYMLFYDILFIDKKGNIIYTVRKQTDYRQNIFKDEIKKSALSHKLKEKPDESFVDFQFYEISGEPSAFFIEPVYNEGILSGWMVMQCAINKINSLFSIDKELGASGEVLLVNKEHYLLTNSRFDSRTTILKQQLSPENIEAKFKERKGNKLVIDYRGNPVLTAFEVFPVFGSEWLIIAKINEGEVLTKYYKENKELMSDIFDKSLQNPSPKYYPYSIPTHKKIEVDMDEYQRTDSGEVLYTHGISTCTAVLIVNPCDFSYMSHISPFDRIYGETRTDILSQMLKQISYLDITESQKMNLEFYVIATHRKTIKPIVDILIEDGYFLSQIHFVQHDNASFANIHSYLDPAQSIVNWRLKNDKNIATQKIKEVKSIGHNLKLLLD